MLELLSVSAKGIMHVGKKNFMHCAKISEIIRFLVNSVMAISASLVTAHILCFRQLLYSSFCRKTFLLTSPIILKDLKNRFPYVCKTTTFLFGL